MQLFGTGRAGGGGIGGELSRGQRKRFGVRSVRGRR